MGGGFFVCFLVVKMFIWFGLIGKNVWMWIDIVIIYDYLYIYTILLFYPNNPNHWAQTTNLTLTDEGG